MTLRGPTSAYALLRVDPRSSATVLFQVRLTGDGTAVSPSTGAYGRVAEPVAPRVPAPANLQRDPFAGSVGRCRGNRDCCVVPGVS